jgi:hypothetical protein
MTNEEIEAAYPRQLEKAVTVTYGPYRRTYQPGTVFYSADFVAARVIQQNIGRRPVAWSVTTGRNFLSLDPYLVQKGLVLELQATQPDSLAPGIDRQRLAGALLDVPTTDRLVWETYRYGPLRSRPVDGLEVTSRSFASTLALPVTQLAYAYQVSGDEPMMIRNLELAFALSPNPALASALSQARLRPLLPTADSQ